MNLALFDFDDTITSKEMFRLFLSTAIAPHRIVAGRIILLPLIGAYHLGVVSGSLIRACLIRLGFSGVPVTQFENLGRDFASKIIPGFVRPEALARINWHRLQGDKVVVVSGSLDVYLKHWCEQQGVDLICSSLEHKNNKLTGRYQGRQCFGTEKARRIKEHYDLNIYPLIYAYGDSKDDLEMMELAHKKFYQWQEMAA